MSETEPDGHSQKKAGTQGHVWISKEREIKSFKQVQQFSQPPVQDSTGTLDVMKAALKDSGDLPFKERLKHLRSTFLTQCEMGDCESYYQLLPSLHFVGANIQKVFVPTGLNKSRLIKKISDEEGKRNKNAMKLNEKGQEGYFIETHNILEKYL